MNLFPSYIMSIVEDWCFACDFEWAIFLICLFFFVTLISSFLHGRHRGEFEAQIQWQHYLWVLYQTVLVPYFATILWLYYSLSTANSLRDMNYVNEKHPLLSVYTITYLGHTLIFSGAYV